jgi:hypothetical protein
LAVYLWCQISSQEVREEVQKVNFHLEAAMDSEEFAHEEMESEDVLEGSDEGESEIDAEKSGIVLEKNDRSLSEFHRWYKERRLILDPEWQRNYVWSDKKASKLVESFLIDIPVPVIYLAKNKDNTYEVIDGLQRLSSAFKFFDGELTLSGLDIRKELNKKTFQSIGKKDQNKLWDVTLRTFELSPATPKELMFVIFERLNTGGTPLNDMEIRNCLFRGNLNRLIKKLAENEDFLTCVNQKNISRRMLDRLLVLRFLAFYERTYMKASKGLKQFFNEFLETYGNVKEDKLKEYESQFNKSMKAAVTVFGNHGFRNRKVDFKGAGEWSPRVNASIFQVISVSFCQYDLGQITRSADAIYEEYLDMLASDKNFAECVTKSTGDPDKIGYAFETWFERVKECLKSSEPADKQRCFSKALKEEMFKQSRTCTLCNQEIKLINDAAMDHDKHYWRGGKTVPSNAQLVHRLCNLKKTK